MPRASVHSGSPLVVCAARGRTRQGDASCGRQKSSFLVKSSSNGGLYSVRRDGECKNKLRAFVGTVLLTRKATRESVLSIFFLYAYEKLSTRLDVLFM